MLLVLEGVMRRDKNGNIALDQILQIIVCGTQQNEIRSLHVLFFRGNARAF
jgi:hypothetical protein